MKLPGDYMLCLTALMWLFHFRFSMAEAQNNHSKYIEVIGQKLFNNKNLSDVTFVVNGNHYHSSKIIMSAASNVFESLIKEKEQHKCSSLNIEVLIPGVKHDESFVNILKYIHGVNINMDTMSKKVLCEMIYLTEHYKLYDFHKELIENFSQLKLFSPDSVIVMLNTAKTFNVTKQYEHLKIIVYHHPDEIFNDESFVNLNYDILLDLVKSDWLYCREIYILRAALNWFDSVANNSHDLESNTTNNTTPEGFEESDIQNLTQSAKIFNIKSSNYTGVLGNKSKDSITENLNVEIGNSTEVVRNNSEKISNGKSNVGMFQENILKTLLSSIRFERIPMSDYLISMKSGIFMKYRDYIFNKSDIEKLNTIQRTPYCDERQCLGIFTIKKASDILKTSSSDITNIEGSFMVGNYTWTISGNTNIENNDKYLGLWLRCTSDKDSYKVSSELLQITIISHDYSEISKNFKITTRFTDVPKFHDIGWNRFISFSKLFEPSTKYINNDTVTLEVLISNLTSVIA